MNRRGFLKAITAVAVAAGISPALVKEVQAQPLLAGEMGAHEGVKVYHGRSFARSTQEFDYGHKVGLCASLTLSGRRWRHAVIMPATLWEGLTEPQREKTWRMVELHTFGCAKRQLSAPVEAA